MRQGSRNPKSTLIKNSDTLLSCTEVQREMELIKQLIKRSSQSPPTEAIRQLAKAAESTMHKVLLLNQEIKGLRAANEKQKRKCAPAGSFMATGVVLTGVEGQQLAQEAQATEPGPKSVRHHNVVIAIKLVIL
ncbi:hypothetical protein GB937_008877 [Aspergillus fischeri]|nr:hypothetical protein GB937_008877 [Aspergillus fischeri]